MIRGVRARPSNGCSQRSLGRDGKPSLGDQEFSKDTSDTPFSKQVDEFLQGRFKHLDGVLASRGWLAGSFSIADILMADVLRLPDRFEGLADYPGCQKYLARATERPAFKKAYADQMEYFAAADKQRA